MKSVFKKELRTYFTGTVLYACFALMFLIAGIYTWAYNIQGASGYFEVTVVSMAFWLSILPVPLLTMRVFAEEKRQRTDKLLYSLPLSSTQIVFGKFFAAGTAMLLPVAVISLFPVIFSFFGNVNFASSYSTVFAFYLLTLALIGAGLFISSMTESQIVAAVVTAVLIFINYFLPYISSYSEQSVASSTVFLLALGIIIGLIVWFLTKNAFVALITAVLIDFTFVLLYFFIPDALSETVAAALTSTSLFSALEVFAGGTFDLTGVVFYLSVTAVFLFLTVQSLEKKRWE